MTTRPIASILINTYNHDRYICQAIDSALDQLGFKPNETEIILIDDGSTDRTEELVRGYGSAIQYVKKANGGQASAFNIGIPMCRGDVVALLDGDDWWKPQKLREVLSTFEANPDAVAVGHGIVLEDQVGNLVHDQTPGTTVRLRFRQPADVRSFRTNMSFCGTSRLSIRRETALALLPVPEGLMFEADEHLFTLLPAIGEVVILPECLTHYRIHGRNLYQDSRTYEGRSAENLRRLRMRSGVFNCLERTLPNALARHGCPNDLIPLLVEPVSVDAARLRLTLGEGTRREAMSAEWREHLGRKLQGTSGSPLLAICRVLAAGALPPKDYYRLRDWYSRSPLRAGLDLLRRINRT